MRRKLLASLLVGTGAMLTLPVVAMADRNECCPSLEVILTGGWFAADGAGTAYAINRTDTNTGGVLASNVMPSGTLERINPKYKWGGGIALAYQSDCCYNWGASYFWYHHTSDDSVTEGSLTASPPGLGIGPTLIPPNVLFPLGITSVLAASSDFKFRYDFANIELGSWVCVIADCLKVNPKIGLSYSRIRDHQSTSYTGFGASGITTSPGNTDEVDMFSRYRGFGPSIGADVVYLFCEEFQLFGNLRYSALVGSLHGEFVNSFSGPGISTTTASLFSGSEEFHSERHMVKLFQSELGLGYTFDWCGYCGSIKAGYQLTQALDAVDRIAFFDSTDRTSLGNKVINASFHGPFIRLSGKFGM